MTELKSNNLDSDVAELSQRPNKTELKRQSAEFLEFGGELIRLKREQLERLELPGELLEALSLARSMKQDGAFKRQKKYISKLLRSIDVEPIRVRLAEITLASTSATRSLHRLEGWRDRLIAGGDAALAELMTDFPQIERPKLRRMIETAQAEMQRGLPPKASRRIFKYLRELIETG